MKTEELNEIEHLMFEGYFKEMEKRGWTSVAPNMIGIYYTSKSWVLSKKNSIDSSAEMIINDEVLSVTLENITSVFGMISKKNQVSFNFNVLNEIERGLTGLVDQVENHVREFVKSVVEETRRDAEKANELARVYERLLKKM
jgi:uncharacterized protein YfkK (UPF0435 family)